MTVWRFIRPVDVLYLRGNRLFGGPGDHAEALMPPWPSVLAGAIRSRMLTDAGVDLGRFTDEAATPPAKLAPVLGTPSEPGSFRLARVALAVRPERGQPLVLHPMPADLVVTAPEDGGAREAGDDRPPAAALAELLERGQRPSPDPVEVHRLEAGPWPGEAATSSPLPLALALRRRAPAKPSGGYWLTGEGMAVYLAGGTPEPGHLIHRRWLWRSDPRLGIARDRSSGTTAKGRLYTTETVALAPGVGFLVGIEGAPEELVPADGLLRLGGDGRGAEIAPWEGGAPAAPATAPDGRFLLYLETPGLFPGGWLPPGVDGATLRLRVDGLEARLAAAAVSRAQVVSGWDVAAHAPKPAQRAVPAGAVYLFDEVHGDPAAYGEQLWEFAAAELGGGWDAVWRQRRAEGFGAVLVGAWPGEAPRA